MRLLSLRGRLATAVALMAMAFASFGVASAMANPGGDTIAGAMAVSLPASQSGSLVATSADFRDLYAVTLQKGKTLEVSLVGTGTSGLDFDLYLYRPGTTTITSSTHKAMWSGGPNATEHFTYVCDTSGVYYIDVRAYSGSGTYTMNAQLTSTVKFSLSKLKVPSKAKKGKKVAFSVVLAPGYNGDIMPMMFVVYHYENHKYKAKKYIDGSGVRQPAAATNTFTATYKFQKKGKWRVIAFFWDEAHTNGIGIGPKKITIK